MQKNDMQTVKIGATFAKSNQVNKLYMVTNYKEALRNESADGLMFWAELCPSLPNSLLKS